MKATSSSISIPTTITSPHISPRARPGPQCPSTTPVLLYILLQCVSYISYCSALRKFVTPRDPPLGVFSSNETFERRLFLRTKKFFELFERLWGGRFAANIVIKCSAQVFLRVWFFGFSLQPPKCPENVFSKCGGLFFERRYFSIKTTRRLQMHIQATTEPHNDQCPCPM